jgi:hypothetical protein
MISKFVNHIHTEKELFLAVGKKQIEHHLDKSAVEAGERGLSSC